MKKILAVLLVLFVMIQTAGAISYEDEYPVIPQRICEYAKETLGIDDAGARFLYEKIVVSDDIITWMTGWFWDDYKIVAGITNNLDIIYYNKAQLGETAISPADDEISPQQAYSTALDFVKKINRDKDIRFVSSKSYTYKFAEYKNGIRIFGHDATVVVDKMDGSVYYYNGFGKYDCNFDVVQTLISKEHALDIYFDKIGMEAVYMLRRDSEAHWQSAKPVYIFNRPQMLAINAQKPSMTEFVMHDYNYYYSDDYVNSFYSPDNRINFDAGVFIKTADIPENKETEQKLHNLFYSLRNGYAFDYSEGIYSFYDDIAGKNEVPCIAVDIYPEKNLVYGEKLKTLYANGDFLSLADYSESLEYIYAKAYLTTNGRLLGFDSVISNKYNPVYKDYNENFAHPPQRVEEFIKRAFDKNEDLRLFDYYEDGYRITYTYARYKNGLRVIGEGVTLTYNAARGDISNCAVNLSTREFPSVKGIKSSREMKPFVKDEVDMHIAYVDFGDVKKIPVYQFEEKQACFDPFAGNRIDRLDFGNVKKTFICNVGDRNYNINGQNTDGEPPLYIDGSFYLPVKMFAAQLGFETRNDGNSIVFASQTDSITVNMEDGMCMVNGKPVVLENKFVFENDEVYIPFTSMVKIFGLQSWWDGNKIIIDAG